MTSTSHVAPLPSRRASLAGALLVLLTLATYQPILTDRAGRFELLDVDDRRYVIDNPHVRTGLTAENARWALTSLESSNWHPLTWMSLQLDCQLHGLRPWGFHLFNLLLHVGSTLLLFVLLFRQTARLAPSWMVAALFAVHPLHVESVAWVAERKDVLSTFCSLLALVAYAAYGRRPSLLRYLVVLLLVALALTAKSMLVTLPCVMLLLDVWPLGRASLARLPRLVGEKLPLLALAEACAAFTLRAQERMMHALDPMPLGARLGNALVYYATYIGRMSWPAGLYLFHPNPGVALPWPSVLGAAGLLAAISLAVAREARRRPYVLVGWLWYLGTLVPVIGLVQVGFVATTDHYTYVPLVGLFILIAFGGEELVARLPPTVARVLVVAPILGCALLSRAQLRHWQSTVTVWERVLQYQPDIAMAHAFLAVALEERGRDDEAERHYARAAELDPSWRDHLDRGLALERAGNLGDARRELEIALLITPHNQTALEHLALQFEARRDLGDAIKHYSTLSRLRPTDAQPEYHLGLLYRERNEPAAARAHLERALERDPTLAEAKQLLDALPAE